MDKKDIPFLNAIAKAEETLPEGEPHFVGKSSFRCPDCGVSLIVEVVASGGGTAECVKCKHRVSLND